MTSFTNSAIVALSLLAANDAFMSNGRSGQCLTIVTTYTAVMIATGLVMPHQASLGSAGTDCGTER